MVDLAVHFKAFLGRLRRCMGKSPGPETGAQNSLLYYRELPK